MIMNIYTDLVKNKRFNCEIRSELLKHSQEHWILATLRYFFPQKYNTISIGESPDLQDHENGIGIEVTAAVREDDMKATRAFSKLHQASSNKDVEKFKRIIELSAHTLDSMCGEIPALCTTGTSDGEKHTLQNIIRKKKTKLQQYRENFKVLGLAIVLPEIPTLDSENHLVDWIREVFQEDDYRFDFVYVISHRFCIYYDLQTDCSCKKAISREEDRLLRTIARMTAEGELSLEDREWQ